MVRKAGAQGEAKPAEGAAADTPAAPAPEEGGKSMRNEPAAWKAEREKLKSEKAEREAQREARRREQARRPAPEQ